MDIAAENSMNNRIIRNTFRAQVVGYVVASLSSVIETLIDGVIIGQFLGLDAVSAFGIVSPLMVAFAMAGAVVSAGARTRYVRLVGEGKVQKAQAVFSLACLLALLFAAAMMLLVLVFATPLTRLLGAAGNAAGLLPRARAYLIGIAIGLPIRNLSWVLWSFLPIDNDRRLLMTASIATTVINTILDLLVIFVLHGDTLEMGLATSLSNLMTLLILLLHFRKKNILLRFSFRDLPWAETGSILRQGFPAGLFRLGNTLRAAFLNHSLAMVAASAAIAAYSVHRQMHSFLNPIILAIADTVAVLAGMLLGERDLAMLRRMFSLAMRTALIVSAGITAVGWLLAPQFSALYIRSDPEALRLAVRATRCFLLGMPLYSVNLIYMNYIQGAGNSLLSSLASTASSVVLPVLAAWLMLPRFGADAVWFSFPAVQLLMLVFYMIAITVKGRMLRIHGGAWQHILLLEDGFDVPQENCMNRSVTSVEEVADLSRSVWNFCDAHGCDERRRYLMSLSVEEMVGNVIEHGFTKDTRRHSVDVRVLKVDEDFILRIRDDCPIFDPVKQLSLLSDSDPSHHIGLRMIINTAKEIDYVCILKLNNLLVIV
jgi:Na+-driven multidrug efflux pump/anti-sigma regulatory factor (Ser/Thr protein kinase)